MSTTILSPTLSRGSSSLRRSTAKRSNSRRPSNALRPLHTMPQLAEADEDEARHEVIESPPRIESKANSAVGSSTPTSTKRQSRPRPVGVVGPHDLALLPGALQFPDEPENINEDLDDVSVTLDGFSFDFPRPPSLKPSPVALSPSSSLSSSSSRRRPRPPRPASSVRSRRSSNNMDSPTLSASSSGTSSSSTARGIPLTPVSSDEEFFSLPSVKPLSIVKTKAQNAAQSTASLQRNKSSSSFLRRHASVARVFAPLDALGTESLDLAFRYALESPISPISPISLPSSHVKEEQKDTDDESQWVDVEDHDILAARDYYSSDIATHLQLVSSPSTYSFTQSTPSILSSRRRSSASSLVSTISNSSSQVSLSASGSLRSRRRKSGSQISIHAVGKMNQKARRRSLGGRVSISLSSLPPTPTSANATTKRRKPRPCPKLDPTFPVEWCIERQSEDFSVPLHEDVPPVPPVPVDLLSQVPVRPPPRFSVPADVLDLELEDDEILFADPFMRQTTAIPIPTIDTSMTFVAPDVPMSASGENEPSTPISIAHSMSDEIEFTFAGDVEEPTTMFPEGLPASYSRKPKTGPLGPLRRPQSFASDESRVASSTYISMRSTSAEVHPSQANDQTELNGSGSSSASFFNASAFYDSYRDSLQQSFDLGFPVSAAADRDAFALSNSSLNRLNGDGAKDEFPVLRSRFSVSTLGSVDNVRASSRASPFSRWFSKKEKDSTRDSVLFNFSPSATSASMSPKPKKKKPQPPAPVYIPTVFTDASPASSSSSSPSPPVSPTKSFGSLLSRKTSRSKSPSKSGFAFVQNRNSAERERERLAQGKGPMSAGTVSSVGSGLGNGPAQYLNVPYTPSTSTPLSTGTSSRFGKASGQVPASPSPSVLSYYYGNGSKTSVSRKTTTVQQQQQQQQRPSLSHMHQRSTDSLSSFSFSSSSNADDTTKFPRVTQAQQPSPSSSSSQPRHPYQYAASPVKGGARTSVNMAVGVTVRRSESRSSVSSEESGRSVGSSGSGLRRKPIPVEIFMRQ